MQRSSFFKFGLNAFLTISLVTLGGLSVSAAGTLNVTVPTDLPVQVTETGDVVVSPSANVVNDSEFNVKIKDISIRGVNSWSVRDNTQPKVNKDDFDKKVIDLTLQGKSCNPDGHYDISGFGEIGSKGGTLDLEYNAELPMSLAGDSEKAAEIVIVVEPALQEAVMAPSTSWYKSSFAKSGITNIEFSTNYTPSGVTEQWDASEAQDGSLICYRVGSKLILAANKSEKIYANANSFEAFRDFSGLQGFTNIELFDTSRIVNMSAMFWGCGFSTIDLSHFDTSNVTNMNSTFRQCPNLTSIDVSYLNVSNVTDMYCFLFYNAKLTYVNFAGWDTHNVQNFRNFVHGCSALTSIDVSMFDTSSATNMNSMFMLCSSLTNLNLSSFDTRLVSDFGAMFRDCRALTSLSIPNFRGDSAVITNSMFRDCRALVTLDISGMTMPNLSDAGAMFMTAIKLQSINEPNWGTTNAFKNAQSMFTNCYSLRSLSLTGMVTSGVTSMQSMFMDCRVATSINTSAFETASTLDIRDMYHNCYALQILYCNNFSVTHLTDSSKTTNMFTGCNSVYQSYGRTQADCNKLNSTVGKPGNVYFTATRMGARSMLDLDLNGGYEGSEYVLRFDLNKESNSNESSDIDSNRPEDKPRDESANGSQDGSTDESANESANSVGESQSVESASEYDLDFDLNGGYSDWR